MSGFATFSALTTKKKQNMKLHYTPDFSHFTNAIEGAVSQCCAAIIEKFQENNIRKIDFFARDIWLKMIFTDMVGTFEESRIKSVGYNCFGEFVIIGENEMSEVITEKGGSGYGILEPVIGKIYEAVAEACHKQDWRDGEVEGD